MTNRIEQIPLNRLAAHPGSPNRMSRTNFGKLVRNIERTGRYEPLVVRPCPGRQGFFQIINGHHRCEALRRLGRETADVLVWNVDDEQTDILLATLNRLNGRDSLEQKLTLLRRLNERIPARQLARLLSQTRGQLERLLGVKTLAKAVRQKAGLFAMPVVFFVDATQQHTIEEALSLVTSPAQAGPRAVRRAAALARLARDFLDRERDDGCERAVTKQIAETATAAGST